MRLSNPALVLFFLSPVLAELMTGSAPPSEFFNPLGFAFIVAWYGSGALLIREIAVRKNLSWGGIFVLGMAFGALEEGIFVKTFFDPHAVDLDQFALLGRYFGTNIPWAVYLTLFHALCSILFPIMLTYLFFRSDVQKAWIGKKRMVLCVISLTGLSLFGWYFFDPSLSGKPYIPRPAHFLGTLVVILILALVAIRLKMHERYNFEKVRTPVRRKVMEGGLLFGALLSLGVWIVVDLSRNSVIVVLYLLIVGWIFIRTKKKIVKNSMPLFCSFIIGNYFFWAFVGIIIAINGVVEMYGASIGFIILFSLMVRYVDRHYTTRRDTRT